MILRKLRMKNFRQFQGTQELVFASDDRDDGKKITVVFGDNGRGKTGIFRAMMFCLYGDHRLSQDAHVEEKELHLVNSTELLDSASDKPVECFVELEFSHGGSDFNLNRAMLGILDGVDIIEERGPVHLFQRTPEGNTKTTEDPTEINRIINSILDHRVREYFLFDGEKIERLTRASSEQRKEISVGLRNLLDIDTLEKAIKATALLQKRLDTEIERKSTGEYAKILSKLKENSERRQQIREALEDLTCEVELAVEEKRKVDKELDTIREISDLLEKRTELESRENELDEALNAMLSEIRSRTAKVSLVLMTNTINQVFKHIDQRKQKGEIPSEIRRDLIDKIISEARCICDREVIEGTEPYDAIIEWKNRASEVLIEDFMLELWRLLSGVRNHFEDTAIGAETLLQRYAITKNDIEQTRLAIKAVSDEIGSSERKDAGKLDEIRGKIAKKIIKLEADRLNYKEELQILEQEHEKLVLQRKEKEREEGLKTELTERASLAAESHSALRAIHSEFTEQIKDLIGKSATKYFGQLIDEQGKGALRRIVVNEDYSVQILDRWNKPFLANISAGQRQIMSISFIAALAKAAAPEEVFEMPFFMDSPFGRLSNEHRRNLILNVPKFANQWILLATDTEFRRQEARLMKKTEKWGNFYFLKGESSGCTNIEQCAIKDAFAYLKDHEVITK